MKDLKTSERRQSAPASRMNATQSCKAGIQQQLAAAAGGTVVDGLHAAIRVDHLRHSCVAPDPHRYSTPTSMRTEQVWRSGCAEVEGIAHQKDEHNR